MIRLKICLIPAQIWDDDEDEEGHSTTSDIWVNALGSTLAISLAPFVILFFLKVDNSKEQQGNLKVTIRCINCRSRSADDQP
jgi:glycopeptide antibiotics resistance protein